jgi:hypothetical protein
LLDCGKKDPHISTLNIVSAVESSFRLLPLYPLIKNKEPTVLIVYEAGKTPQSKVVPVLK